MRTHRLKIGLDVDDVLYDCNAYALSIVNANHPDEEPMTINDIKGWGDYGRHSEERIALYSDPEFVKNQPVFPGAQKLVRDLTKFADVFFVTAVPVSCMSARGERLLQDFPEVPPKNIIIGTRKDIMNLDILLDDAAHNIAASKATYPVLFRRPWNMDMSGLLSINSYRDFLSLCKMIRNSFTEKVSDLTNGGVICLVGPSGSLKNEIAINITEHERYEKPVASTTRPKREHETQNSYRFISEDQFIKERDEGCYIESTVYSGYHFGTPSKEISDIVARKNLAVIPIDVCGALSLCNEFSKRTLLVFINRQRKDVLSDIVDRDISREDKVRRIMSLDFEYRNAEICDVELTVDDNPKDAADRLISMIEEKYVKH